MTQVADLNLYKYYKQRANEKFLLFSSFFAEYKITSFTTEVPQSETCSLHIFFSILNSASIKKIPTPNCHLFKHFSV